MSAAGLERALHALEALIAVRLEERALPPLERPLGAPHATPPLAAHDALRAHPPLAELIDTAELTPAEAVIVLAAVAPAVDEKFDALFARLTDREDARGLTPEIARTLVARTFQERLDANVLLGPTGRLRSLGLVTVESGMSSRLLPDPDLVAWLLGIPISSTSDMPAQLLTTVHTLDDVILPGPARERVRELVARIGLRERVVDEWGFGAHHDNVSGLVALFHGPPGTGKTMTASTIARATGMPAYIVDLSAIVSKYIGETEKNLSKIFDLANRQQCILVFDEADALFGRRTEVSDSHDRYANQEVSYLLSRIETHPGVVILTTNLLANIDSAFQRRIHVTIEFLTPGASERGRLWNAVLPRAVPVADNVDLTGFARKYPLTGAQIRDAAVDAAYLAADEGTAVGTPHLITGVLRQFEKSGRTAPR